jgi:hypothetical protein
MNLSSSPSPLDSILSSHPIYSSYEEGSNYLVSHPVPTVILDSNPCNSTLKGVFSASPFPSQCTSKPLSKKKASKRRSQVKNACGMYPFSLVTQLWIHVQHSNVHS